MTPTHDHAAPRCAEPKATRLVLAGETAGAAALLSVALAVGLPPSPAAAQVVERNLPPAPGASPAPLVAPQPAIAPEQDARPIGPALRAIVLLGPVEAARAGPTKPGGTPVDGVPIGQAAIDLTAVARVNNAGAVAALHPFLGRPLSLQLVAQVQAAVTRLYRRAGFPFVSVSPPEQELTGGVLQLRVVEYRAGRVNVAGQRRASAAYIEGRVRTKPGDPIDARALSDDLDWLDRNPFRQVQAAFSPGEELGRTDLNLAVTQSTRPYQVYGGYAQSGSAATGRDRYILGAQAAGLPFVPDAVLSYQFTGAADAFQTGHPPQYVSHAARVGLPLLPRQSLELSYDHVESNQPVQDFVARQVTDEITGGWRSALSNFAWPSPLHPRGDVSLGVEARQSASTLLFGGQDVRHATIDVFQVYTGYTGTFLDRLGGSTLNATLHVSPGGFDRRNTDDALTAFSQGRRLGGAYAYAGAQFSRATRLPWRLTLSTEIIAQYAGAALPDTEQIGLGGPSLVRGYSLDDGAFDSGVIARDALVAPAFRLLPAGLKLADAFQPRLFVDAGYGFEREVHRDLTAVSAGFGADWRIASFVQLSGDLACPLRHGPYTPSGDCRVEGRLNLSY